MSVSVPPTTAVADVAPPDLDLLPTPPTPTTPASPTDGEYRLPEPPVLKRPSRLAQAVRTVLLGVLGFVLFGLAWAWASARSGELPGPLQTLDTLKTLLGTALESDGPAGKGIGLQLLDSLSRVLKGFALATIVGVPVGFVMGVQPTLRRMLNPIVQVLRPVSPLAWFPIWLTIMVKAEPAAIWVIFISAVWPTILNTAAGAASVPKDHLDVSKVFRFTRRTELREVVIPHAMPSVVTGLRLSMGVAWMVIVAAEMLSAASGIGFFVWQSYNGQGLTHVISAVILIGATGLVLDLAFQALGRRVAHEEVRP
jgi:nitrate/nitrite transport system permease protein